MDIRDETQLRGYSCPRPEHAMQNNVEEVRLGGNGRRSGFVELDWDSLLSYDGRGRCRVVECSGQTRKRYGHKLEILGKTMGWSVEKGSLYVLIKRK